MPRSGAPLNRSFAQLFKDQLTVTGFSPGPEDATGVPIGSGVTRALVSQMGSDEDVMPSKRFQGQINSGVQGSLPVSVFITPYFKLPALLSGETLVYQVNGRTRPLMRQGPGQNAAGQNITTELELGAPI